MTPFRKTVLSTVARIPEGKVTSYGAIAAMAGASLLLVVSDHGNFEDWTTSKHTTNPALTILTGAGFEKLVPQLQSLLDIKRALLLFL